MRTSTIKILSVILLIMSATLLFSSCQEEDEFINSTSTGIEKKYISFEQFKQRIQGNEIHDDKLDQKINPEKYTMQNATFSDDFVNSISEDEVMVMTQDGKETYTLKTETDDGINSITNLVIT